MDRNSRNIRFLIDLKTIIIAFLISTTGFYAAAQEVNKNDTLVSKPLLPDTSAVKPEAADTTIAGGQRVHSPKRATIYSAVFPGLGQLYNRKYWKVPIIYIGLASLIYAIDWNNDYYVLYRQAYADIIDDDPTSNSFRDLDIEGNWDFNNPSQVQQFTTRLERAKESSRRYRDLCIIGTAAFYALNIIDATVDAHLFNFDISDDLTMNWMPQPIYAMDQPLMGFHCVINF
ncbi:MAG: DUF5683 domain-containing protein [Prolixibacteraceae bacterium]